MARRGRSQSQRGAPDPGRRWGFSRIARTRARSPRTRSSSRTVRDLVGLDLNPARARGRACAWMRTLRPRRWSAARRSRRSSQMSRRARPMTTRAPEPRAPIAALGSGHRQAHRSSPQPVSARSSSSSFLQTIDREVPADLDVHVVLDTAQRTRRQRSTNGGSRTPASSCPSPGPAARSSTSSSAGSPN